MRVLKASPAFQYPASGLLLCLLLLPAFCGCSLRKKPSSYNRIILEGDPNPTIHDDPVRAGEILRRSDEPRQQPRTYQAPQPTQETQPLQ